MIVEKSRVIIGILFIWLIGNNPFVLSAETDLCAVQDSNNFSTDEIEMKLIPGGEFEMGDHHNFVDPKHGGDETPIHTVRVDSFYMASTETTNKQFCDYLNSALEQGLIEVRDNLVYAADRNDIYCFTHQFADYSSIAWDGATFYIIDHRANHPMVGVMWFGAAAFCNWLSSQHDFESCYDESTWECDFTRNGFRLPTEAEWEYAGRGGQYDPYYIFPWGDDADNSKANWPNSGDPFETGPYPWTTPVGFYNGELHQKADFNWPGSQANYQSSDGANAYGLYDMAGNVWEFVNDWYGREYYSISPVDNPRGPESGTIMPDGKAYRGMRSGNWYNGENGHSRVANRNPSYYRGPDDPNHAWYHVGFRTVRNFETLPTGLKSDQLEVPNGFVLFQNYPNPFNLQTTISFELDTPGRVQLKIFNTLGKEVKNLVNIFKEAGCHEIFWDGTNDFGQEVSSGIYIYQLQNMNHIKTRKMILMR